MTMRVYELAKELGVSNSRILELLPALNIEATSHMSTLTDDDVERIKAALSPAEGEVVRFDKRTGKGEVFVPTSDKNLEFDLRSTRLASTKYAPIQPGNKVRVEVDGDQISSIAVDS
jgi:ribosomal protein S13